MRYLGLHQSGCGIWHYEFERAGKTYWASLHTRDEREAKRKFAEMVERLETAQREATALPRTTLSIPPPPRPNRTG